MMNEVVRFIFNLMSSFRIVYYVQKMGELAILIYQNTFNGNILEKEKCSSFFFGGMIMNIKPREKTLFYNKDKYLF